MSGKVNEADHRNIKKLVDAFRKKYKASNVELNGTAISFLENRSLAEEIIATLRKAQVIPQNAIVLDFPERETKSSNATPWIATFADESKVHPDILYNVSIGRKGTTVVSIYIYIHMEFFPVYFL
jgi:EAL domain-containing protein (putative c-di-GMP-specific phosphodiesterase class I)